MIDTSRVTQKRKRRRYATVFAFVFVAVFGIANSPPYGFEGAVGAGLDPGYYSWSKGGWPSEWFCLDYYSPREFTGGPDHDLRFEGARMCSWSACLGSVAACGSIAAALVAILALAWRVLSRARA